MDKILALFEDFGIATVLVRLLLAALAGGLIGSERGKHGRAAGLRTHILVCIGAAMTSLTSMYLSECLGYTGDIARLSAQVISGIGFLGAGTILIRNSSVITGLTTAAGMWTTATIGIALGYGFYVAAITATLICIFSVTILSRLERKRKNTINAYLELKDLEDVEKVAEIFLGLENIIASYDIIPPKSGYIGNVGIVFTMHGRKNLAELKMSIRENCNVAILIKEINL